MAIIYRVQDAEGRGPFRPGFSHRWVEDRPDHDNLVPWPIEFGRVDRIAVFCFAIGCGCRTIEQLRRWFTKSEYSTLLSLGYAAVKLKVGRVLAESSIQCVFERAKPLRDGAERFDLYERVLDVLTESPAASAVVGREVQDHGEQHLPVAESRAGTT